MRCDSCNKFVSFDTDVDPEVTASYSGGAVDVEVRIVNQCAECGQELKEANFSLTVLEEKISAHMAASKGCANKDEVSVDVQNEQRTDRRQIVDRRGKPIRNPRYQKQFYGFSADIIAHCDTCDEDIASVTVEDEVQGSSMDELV